MIKTVSNWVKRKVVSAVEETAEVGQASLDATLRLYEVGRRSVLQTDEGGVKRKRDYPLIYSHTQAPSHAQPTDTSSLPSPLSPPRVPTLTSPALSSPMPVWPHALISVARAISTKPKLLIHS